MLNRFLRVVRWLVLHANGDKQVLALDKRHLIQVGTSPLVVCTG